MAGQILVLKKTWWRALLPYALATPIVWIVGWLAGGWVALAVAALLIVALAFWYPDRTMVLAGVGLAIALSWVGVVVQEALFPPRFDDFTTGEVAAISFIFALAALVPACTIALMSVTLFERYLRVGVAPDECPGCGYSLRGLTSGRCPECGTTLHSRRS